MIAGCYLHAFDALTDLDPDGCSITLDLDIAELVEGDFGDHTTILPAAMAPVSGVGVPARAPARRSTAATRIDTADLLLLSRRLSPLAYEIVAHHWVTAIRPTHEDLVEWLHLQREHAREGDEHDAACEALRVVGAMDEMTT